MPEQESPKNAGDLQQASQNEEQTIQSKVEELRKHHPSMFSEDEPIDEDYSGQFEREQQQPEEEVESEKEEVSPESEEQPQEPKEESANDDKKDGLPSLEELDLPEDLGLEAPEGELPELPDTEEAKAFAKQFQEYLGISVEEFKAAAQDYKKTIEYVEQVRAENYYNQSIQNLSSEWNVDKSEVESRLEKVRERFNKYPQDMQDRLDNPEGAKLIWAKIEQEQQKQQKPEVPTFQKSTPGSPKNAGKKPLFTREQLANMTPEEYAANNEKIIEAYILGQVR